MVEIETTGGRELLFYEEHTKAVKMTQLNSKGSRAIELIKCDARPEFVITKSATTVLVFEPGTRNLSVIAFDKAEGANVCEIDTSELKTVIIAGICATESGLYIFTDVQLHTHLLSSGDSEPLPPWSAQAGVHVFQLTEDFADLSEPKFFSKGRFFAYPISFDRFDSLALSNEGTSIFIRSTGLEVSLSLSDVQVSRKESIWSFREDEGKGVWKQLHSAP